MSQGLSAVPTPLQAALFNTDIDGEILNWRRALQPLSILVVLASEGRLSFERSNVSNEEQPENKYPNWSLISFFH